MNESAPTRRRQLGIRAQVAAATAALLAVMQAVGIVLFANLVTSSLGRDLAASLTTETNVVVAALAAEGPRALVGVDTDDANIIQLIGPSGALVYTSNPNAISEPLTAMRPQAPARQIEGIRTWWTPWDGQPPLVVQATGVELAGATYTVVVATSQAHTLQAVNSMAAGLGVAAPIIIFLGAVLSSGLVTRFLRPVDSIRRRVESVSASNLSERVSVVPTGDEIEALAHTMNRMLTRLDVAKNSQRQFVADASHELRSPIATLRGALEIAARTGSIDTWTEIAPLLQAETDRLGELVSDLLLLSRIDDHGVGLEIGDVDLDDVALTEAAALQARTALTVSTDLVPARIQADRARLLNVVRNLADNAARHAAGKVLFKVRVEQGTPTLVVADDGHGIDPADRDRVFDRFVRLDESRSRDRGGVGLGLAIVRELVAAHGGTVTVGTSAELGGAEFTIRLPQDSPYHS